MYAIRSYYVHALGALPEPLVDTQVACAMLGQPLQLALQGTVRWLFEVRNNFV